jgi:hypothetical protein
MNRDDVIDPFPSLAPRWRPWRSAGGSKPGAGRGVGPGRRAARSPVTAAQRAYEQGKFEGRAHRLQQRLRLSELPVLLFNLAQCHRQLRHYERGRPSSNALPR